MNRFCKQCNATNTIWWKKDGDGFLCNPCYKRQWYLANRPPLQRFPATPERTKEQRKRTQDRYYQKHKEKIKTYFDSRKDKKSEYDREYRKKNKDKLYGQYYNRLKNDLGFRLKCTLRGRISGAMRDFHRGQRKGGSAVKDLGCSVQFLKQHLESKFQPGMTWDNWGVHGWHIDHIVPLDGFDLTNREQFLKACHYANLQPLWAIDNLRKGSKHE